MELRFADAAPEPANRIDILVKADFACQWCGFRCEAMQIVSVDDGEPHVACPLCYDARHLNTVLRRDNGVSEVIWAPEITQPALNHLIRSCVFVKHHFYNVLKPKASPPAVGHAGEILKDLMGRHQIIKGIVSGLAEPHVTTLADAWPMIDAQTQELLLTGLRLLPYSVSKKAVSEWSLSDGTMNGFGKTHIENSGWFLDEIGLKLPPQPVDAASTETVSVKEIAA